MIPKIFVKRYASYYQIKVFGVSNQVQMDWRKQLKSDERIFGAQDKVSIRSDITSIIARIGAVMRAIDKVEHFQVEMD